VSQQIAGIYGVDTRAITKRLRSQGVMMGVLTHGPIDAAKRALGSATRYDDVDFIKVVTTNKEYRWGVLAGDKVARYRVLVYDYGLKYNILRLLESRGCEVLVVPAETPAKEMLNANIDGILLSPGPGDPLLLDYLVENTKTLLGQIPIMGICLGHQIAARALGAKTFKLKFGHRGGNHPVKDLDTGRIFITSQNHGYAIDASTLDDGCKVSHVNLNDNTVEGLIHSQIPLISIQYHSEASPGPRDNEYMFDRFLGLMEAHKIGKGGM
jgi:carbamoyl-phosphate synthase small subunit